MTPGYPFSAIVGQQALCEALLVNAVSPEVGGVLVRGERGTAKSTAVRALAPLLPSVPAAVGQPFCFAPGDMAPDGVVDGGATSQERPAPLVELPVGATIDRLVGALDLGRALAGERAFEAGLLARAHRGVLYVDEVNLLPDHLVDVLLDAAAMGVCHVERDAVSVRHDARFLLVGTMNAEEGELRPQLLDRFGLGVEVAAPVDPATRAEIVRRRLAYEADPLAFAVRFADADADVAASIVAARERLPRRAAARARAGPHRARVRRDRRRRDARRRRDRAHRARARGPRRSRRGRRRARPPRRAPRAHAPPPARPARRRGGGPARHRSRARRRADPEPPSRRRRPSRRPEPPEPSTASQAVASNGDAPERAPESPDLAAPAPRDRLDAPERALSLRLPAPPKRAAAAEPIDSRRREQPATTTSRSSRRCASGLTTGDAGARRVNVRAGRDGVLLCLVIDASGSMAARRRMARVKGALLGLLQDAYARRDRVAIVAFRDARAQLVHVPGAPLEHAAAAVQALRTGGRTPLAAGLDAATELIRRERSRDPGQRAVAVVLTDGRAPAAAAAAARLGRAADAVHVVDTEEGAVRLGLAGSLAAAAGATVIALAGAEESGMTPDATRSPSTAATTSTSRIARATSAAPSPSAASAATGRC